MDEKVNSSSTSCYKGTTTSPEEVVALLNEEQEESPKNCMIRELREILSSTEITAREFLELWTAFDSDGKC